MQRSLVSSDFRPAASRVCAIPPPSACRQGSRLPSMIGSSRRAPCSRWCRSSSSNTVEFVKFAKGRRVSVSAGDARSYSRSITKAWRSNLPRRTRCASRASCPAIVRGRVDDAAVCSTRDADGWQATRSRDAARSTYHLRAEWPRTKPPRPFVGRMFYYVLDAPRLTCISSRKQHSESGGSRNRGGRRETWVGAARLHQLKFLRRAPTGARSR